MRERLIKPRVFLSHARRDVKFIERIENDLRKCQLEPWRDQNEIRDGQPWLSAIFEDGIPTCDAIVAYYTDNALSSEMVGKEVDSAILQRLTDSHVAFLPYVDSDETRSKLRVDIRTLQTRVWNEENHSEILPSVVAEIWRSFLERSINNAVLSERNQRLELQLELQMLQQSNSSPFTPTETADFNYIFERLNRRFELMANIIGRPELKEETVRSYRISFSLLPVFVLFARDNRNYDGSSFEWFFASKEMFGETFAENFKRKENEYSSLQTPDLTSELNVYGLVELRISENPNSFSGGIDRHAYYYFTPKLPRLLFWLEFNKLVSADTELEIQQVEITTESDDS